MKLFLSIIFTTITVLTAHPALGAVTFSDTGDGVQRPDSVTALDVNGVTYDVTITYNIAINRATLALIGDLPDIDADLAAFALLDAINAVATADSNETIIYLLSNAQPNALPPALSLARIEDQFAGIADFQVFLSNTNVTSSARAARGVASFSLAVMTVSSAPEPTSLVICTAIGLTGVLRKRRRPRVTHAGNSDEP